MVRSLVRLWDVDPGFSAHNVETFNISMPPAMASATPQMLRAKHLALNEALAAVPGVTAVSQTWGAVPMAGDDEQWFWIDGQPKPGSNNDMSWAIDYIVDPDYLRVMQVPLKRGRFLSRHDDEHAPLVVVVDEVFANKYFPGQDPIGKRIDLKSFDGKAAEIVGVVGHVKQWGLDSDDAQDRTDEGTSNGVNRIHIRRRLICASHRRLVIDQSVVQALSKPKLMFRVAAEIQIWRD